MRLSTRFDIGDTVWAVQGNPPRYPLQVVGPLTIGHVRASVTDSPGRPGEELFDNYKPQKGSSEEYMCVETGIGTGTVYRKDRLADSPDRAQRLLINMNNAATDCYQCTHHRNVPGNAHIQCVDPDPEMTGDPHGVKHGWFVYPFLFDPVWRTKRCSNFQPMSEGDT